MYIIRYKIKGLWEQPRLRGFDSMEIAIENFEWLRQIWGKSMKKIELFYQES